MIDHQFLGGFSGDETSKDAHDPYEEMEMGKGTILMYHKHTNYSNFCNLNQRGNHAKKSLQKFQK